MSKTLQEAQETLLAACDALAESALDLGMDAEARLKLLDDVQHAYDRLDDAINAARLAGINLKAIDRKTAKIIKSAFESLDSNADDPPPLTPDEILKLLGPPSMRREGES